jgi:hypothetical protein
VRHVEFAGALAFLAPRLDELAVLVELDDAGMSPWPSATKMSPFWVTTTSEGPLKWVSSSPACPGVPRVISTLPSGESFMTVWPFFLPLSARPSVIQTLSSLSTNRPCGNTVMPAPIAATTRPFWSYLVSGAMLELSQVLPPQRS